MADLSNAMKYGILVSNLPKVKQKKRKAIQLKKDKHNVMCKMTQYVIDMRKYDLSSFNMRKNQIF